MKTPLYEAHKKAGARMVDFAGWEMPVQYIGISQEHRHVRQKVGLFDVSHMGEIEIRGPQALEAVNYLTTNNVPSLKDGEAQYSVLLNEQGKTIDDLIIYRRAHDNFFLCVNASNKPKDLAWIQDKTEKKFGNQAIVEDVSSRYGLLAIQGPLALSVVEKLSSVQLSAMKPFSFLEISLKGDSPKGIPVLLSRTGYTGEDGFEIFVPWEKTALLWETLMEAGRSEGIAPIGLGARDTLRVEMKYSLYGHEIDETTNPLEASLGWIVKLDKGNFIGKDELIKIREKGVLRKLVSFLMKDSGIPRQGYSLFKDSTQIGVVTSGTLSPSLEKAIGIGYVTPSLSKVGTEIEVDIRGQKKKAEIVIAPFYRRRENHDIS
ncbi:MAG: glycine cleavage system aminomethyltransferase GcvT [Deltaproteobacteria bacterium]|nr:glycine cleavage system aminomethyltransferase GcvT [Deltaproteobacteria bacterium]